MTAGSLLQNTNGGLPYHIVCIHHSNVPKQEVISGMVLYVVLLLKEKVYILCLGERLIGTGSRWIQQQINLGVLSQSGKEDNQVTCTS